MTDHPDEQVDDGTLPQDDVKEACPDTTPDEYSPGQEEGVSTTTPSEEKCIFGDNEVCITHSIKASIVYVSSKKWSLIKSTNSYGWKYQKVRKQICRHRSFGTRGDQNISKTPTFKNLQWWGNRSGIEKTLRTLDGARISGGPEGKENGLANGD